MDRRPSNARTSLHGESVPYAIADAAGVFHRKWHTYRFVTASGDDSFRSNPMGIVRTVAEGGI